MLDFQCVDLRQDIFVEKCTFVKNYPGQSHTGSGTYPRNADHKPGMNPEWDASPQKDTTRTIRTHWRLEETGELEGNSQLHTTVKRVCKDKEKIPN